MSDGRSIALLGLQETGKSTFLGALWQIVQDPSERSVSEEEISGDRSYINELGATVARAEAMPRTEVDSDDGLLITLRFANEGTVRISIPDLSGESVRELVEDRRWRSTLRRAVADSSAFMLFVHPERIEDAVPVTLAAAAAVAGGEAEPAGGTVTDEPKFRPELACTSAKLIELLENVLAAIEPSEPVPVAVVVSAWDTVPGASSPVAWLEERLPGVHDMLASNPDLVRFRVFGVSAQGGRLPDQYEELIDRGVAQRAFAVGADGTRVRLSEPLRWAVWS